MKNAPTAGLLSRVASIVLDGASTMKPLPLLALLLVSSPALAQSRLYTNQDLGRPLSSETATVAPERLTPEAALTVLTAHVRPFAGLLDRAATLRGEGPSIVVIDSSPTFTQSTDVQIATPANYTIDMVLSNEAAIYQALLAGRAGRHRSRVK